MANTPTPNRYLLEPALNDLNWNTTLNANFTAIDQALGSSFPVSVGTGGTVALTSSTTPSGSVYWYTALQLNVTATGTLTSNAIITLPSSINASGTMSGSWIVANNLTAGQQGSFTLTIKGASGTGVTIAQGSSAFVYFDGTNVSYADNNVGVALTDPTFNTATVTSDVYLNTTSGRTTIGTPKNQVVTIAIGASAIVTLTSATPLPTTGTPVYFSTTGALPTGLNTGTIYYVVFPTSGGFQLSATPSGSAITTSGTQSGVHTVYFGIPSESYVGANSNIALGVPAITEVAVYTATSATGTINYDLINQSIVYYTSAATGNWTINFRGNSTTTLNNTLKVGQAVTAVFIASNQNAAAQTATISVASPAVITVTTAPANGTPVTFSTTGTLPTGLSTGTTYYVINASGTTFNVSTSVGGAARNTTAAGSGTHTATFYGLFNNAVTVDGVSVTPRWQGGTTPTTGNNNSNDVYTYTIIKTSTTPTYAIFASQTQF